MAIAIQASTTLITTAKQFVASASQAEIEVADQMSRSLCMGEKLLPSTAWDGWARWLNLEKHVSFDPHSKILGAGLLFLHPAQMVWVCCRHLKYPLRQ